MRFCLLLAVLLGITANLAAAETVAGRDETALAAEILNATDVQGGLVVHVGCGDGRLTAALAASESFLVHGLDTDADNVAAARMHIQSLGSYGRISVDQYDGLRLPYIENTVNLLVVSSQLSVAREELLRVLCPGGVAITMTTDDGPLTTDQFVKPWPENIDEWTHFLHDSDNNAVAHDEVVASPLHVQWVGQSKWARHHNHLASMSALVSSGGRIFGIVDEGPVASINLPSRWFLIARDAFNGVLLWKKPLGPWEGHLRPFRSGPPELSRRLVAVGDRVFVTLGYGKPLTCLDAATGDVATTYDQTEGTVEVICCDGILYVVVGQLDPEQYAAALRRGSASPPPRAKGIHAIRADTGETLWVKQDADTHELFPTTLCAAGGRVLFHSTGHVVCLDAQSGKELWRAARAGRTSRLGWSTPTLVAHKDVVLCADCASPPTDGAELDQPIRVQWGASARPKRGDDSLGQLIAFSAADGKQLWSCATAQGYNAPADVFVADGLVWTSTVPNLTSEDFAEGRDPLTGEVRRQLDTAAAFTTTHHHRCYRNKATDRYILLGRTGTELIDLAGEEPLRHCWFRGTCQYGVMPCNGLIYAPPHSCACYIQSKLSGFWALAPGREEESKSRKIEKLKS
jgi:outer membrane protein assembly factor BamB